MKRLIEGHPLLDSAFDRRGEIATARWAISAGIVCFALGWILEFERMSAHGRGGWGPLLPMFLWGFCIVYPIRRVLYDQFYLYLQPELLQSIHLSGMNGTDILRLLVYRSWRQACLIMASATLGLLFAFPYLIMARVTIERYEMIIAFLILLHLSFPFVILAMASISALAIILPIRSPNFRVIVSMSLGLLLGLSFHVLPWYLWDNNLPPAPVRTPGVPFMPVAGLVPLPRVQLIVYMFAFAFPAVVSLLFWGLMNLPASGRAYWYNNLLRENR